MSTPNKEQAYDAEVAPLMDKVIEICRREGISMIAHFELPIPGDPDLVCTTKTPDEKGVTSGVIRTMLKITGLKPGDIIGRGGIPRTPSPL
jgi:hypothetical protein